MKRAISLLLAMLVLALPACGALAESTQTFATDYYTLTLPSDWTIDSSEANGVDEFRTLGYLYAPEVPGLVIEAGLIHYEDMSDVSL